MYWLRRIFQLLRLRRLDIYQTVLRIKQSPLHLYLFSSTLNELNKMTDIIASFFALIAVTLLQIKIILYFRSTNPGKSILWAYASGQIVQYAILSLFPLKRLYGKSLKNAELLDKLTYSFYIAISISFLIVFLGYALKN